VSGRSKDQDLIDWLAAKIQGPDPKTAQTNGHTRTAPGSPTDEMVIEKCRAAKDAARFSELFDHGDTSANDNNTSSADYALLGILKFWTQDPDQLDRIMRLSALRRPKWDEGRAGRTWLRYSIDNTLRTVDKTHDWGSQRGRTLVS
jgi:primase-polymerase (primpol)-like protein